MKTSLVIVLAVAALISGATVSLNRVRLRRRLWRRSGAQRVAHRS